MYEGLKGLFDIILFSWRHPKGVSRHLRPSNSSHNSVPTFIPERVFVGLDDLGLDGVLQVGEHAVEDGEVEATEEDFRKERALEKDDVPRLQNLEVNKKSSASFEA